MAVVTQIINGYLADSSGDSLSSGFVRFSLSRYDTSSNGVISSYKDIDTPIQTDGSILQELWPNSRGSDGTYYHVLLLDDKRKIKESLGIIRVEDAGPYELSDLIEAQSTGGEPTLYRVMTKAEYDALILAAQTVDVEGNATAALEAAEDAQAWAESPTAPGDPGTKSAKTWAGEAADSASAIAPYPTRSDLVTAIAGGLLDGVPGGAILWASGLGYLKMPANHPLYGTDPIPDMPGFFGLEITPYHFGAIGDGVTDDTSAFAAMWAAYELLTSYTTNNGLFRALFGTVLPWKINLKSGRYVVNEGWKPNSSAGRIMKIVGDGPTQAVIIMPTDGSGGYLIEQEDRTDGGTPYKFPYHSVHCEGFKLVGGKGLYINREADAPLVQRGVHVEMVDIVGFTECGIASLWGDDPRWTLRSVRIETTAPNTKGLYLPRGVANPSFVDVTIIGCTYRVVTAPGSQSTSFISGLTMFSIPNDDHEADIWFTTIVPADNNAGIGVVVSGNRFSNENRNGKPIVLIADMDGVGEEQTQSHVAATSTRRFRDWKFVNNTLSGQGSADAATAGPMIVTYTADIGAAEVRDNVMNVGFSRLLQMNATPSQAHAIGLQIGPNQFGGTGEPPSFCNLDVGNWVANPGSENPGKETPLTGTGSKDPNYLIVSVTGSGQPLTMGTVTASGASLVSSAPYNQDPFGFNDSRAVVFNTDADYVEMSADTTQLSALGLGVNENYFVEFWHKNMGSNILTEVDCEIFINTASTTLTKRFSVKPTAKWLPFRVAIPSHLPPTGFRVRWFASVDAWSASTDRFQLARPRAYRANRPTPNTPMFLTPFKKGQLTSASAAASYPSLIYVTDEVGGAVPAFSDGTNWRRITDREIVS